MPGDAVRADPDADPFLWLEEIEGADALAWVRERNAETLAWAEADPAFGALRAELLALLDADDRIPAVVQRGGRLYDHWRDAAHPRGLWRRTTPAAFRSGTPDWEILLDIDALAAAEGEPWVWAGALPLPPDHDRWIVELSRGGADATVAREWDLPSRSFVADGFALPEAKHEIAWVDRDTLLVGTETGPGSLTTSGYPRLLRRWRRGTAVADAEVVLTAEPDDVAVGAWSDHTPGFARALCTRAIDFYSGETTLLLPDGTRALLPLPPSAEPHLVRDHLLVELREDWATGGTTYPAGALLAIVLADFLGGARTFDILFAPGPTSALAALVPTRSRVVLDILDDVRHRVVARAPRPGGGWTAQPGPRLPARGSGRRAAWDRGVGDALLLSSAVPRTPPRGAG
ncbi:MAG: S9 family peptidase, partial [Chloroflexota bacterium]